MGISPQYVTSHSGQLSLLPSVGWELWVPSVGQWHCSLAEKVIVGLALSIIYPPTNSVTSRPVHTTCGYVCLCRCVRTYCN